MKRCFLVVFSGWAMVLSACTRDARLPICKSDGECAQREDNGGKVLCDNLRCVQCRYDPDCPAGGYCDKTQICQGITPKQTADSDVSTADYKTLDECLKACTDAACTDVCNALFPETKKKARKRR